MPRLHKTIPMCVLTFVVAFGLSLALQQALGINIGSDLDFGSTTKILNVDEITLSSPPTAPNDAASKAYVDAAVAAAGGGPGDWSCQSVVETSNYGIYDQVAVAECPSGYTLITGGCGTAYITDNQMYIANALRGEGPLNNKWQCFCYFQSAANKCVARAWCCQ